MADGSPTTMGTTVAVEIEGPVGTITLNRPDKLNAFTVEMVGELIEALERVTANETVRAVVLTGAGRAFCAGADVDLLKEILEQRDQERGEALVDGARAILHAIRLAPQPVICALNGVAAGGGANLALGCDLRIAADTARIGQVFGRIGLHPDWGGTYFLPRLVGTAHALELFLSGELVPADRLLALGLVNRVVPAADLPRDAAAWAREIAAGPPHAVRLVKQAVYHDPHAAFTDEALDAALGVELEAQLECFKTRDALEGLTAFLAKREPRFTGR